jgi:hypothetical protein
VVRPWLALMRRRAREAVVKNLEVDRRSFTAAMLNNLPLPPVNFAFSMINKQTTPLSVQRIVLTISQGGLAAGKYSWWREEWEDRRRTAIPGITDPTQWSEVWFVDMESPKQNASIRFTWTPPLQSYAFLHLPWEINGFLELRSKYGPVRTHVALSETIQPSERQASLTRVSELFPSLIRSP